MNKAARTFYFLLLKGIAALSFLLLPALAFAQQNVPEKDTGKSMIHILNNDYGEFIQQDGQSVQKLMFNVKLRYDSDTIYCDSAFFYVKENSVEAFGDVAIFQADGTKAFAEYMRYTGHNKMVYMKSNEGDVQIEDNEGNIIWSKDIIYNLKTKIGNYDKNGVLQNQETIVSSRSGSYNVKTKNARFKGDVIIEDPQYKIWSSDLGYNTESKIVTFLDVSTVINDESILKTTSGFYNTIDSTAYFTKRSAIWNESQFLEADTIDYSHKVLGVAFAKGDVIALDTAQKITLFSQRAIFKESTKELTAFGAPLLRAVNDNDSLYIKADTFFSAPIPKDSLESEVQDSVLKNKTPEETAEELRSQTIINNRLSENDSIPNNQIDSLIIPLKDSVSNHQVLEEKDTLISELPTNNTSSVSDSILTVLDTINRLSEERRMILDSITSSYDNQPQQTDSSAPRYFKGYYQVRIYSDSLQGACDSVFYSQKDSLLRMFKAPYLWPNKSQVSGTEIHLKLDSNRMRELIVPEEGILINRSGPETANMFNQIQGKVINGYFEDNQLKQLFASPNASSIYYITDDNEEYIGCSQASSREIEIQFDSTGRANKIFYRQDVKQKMIPIKDVIPSAMRLERFQWTEEQRPKDLESFLKGVTQPRNPEWD